MGARAARAARGTVAALIGITCIAGCRPSASGTHSAPRATPYTEAPCTQRPSPGQPTIQTKLAWRTETMADGSVRATLGDIDLAPRAAGTVRRADYRAPGPGTDCTQVKILTVRGWWCTTTVSAVTEHGEIVVGGAAPRARLTASGFRTTCSAGAPHHRTHYALERDSWSGWRPYARRAATAWTEERTQTGPAVSAPCPQGRVGTYTYRLAAALDVTGYSDLADTPASGRTVRQDCGTGIS